MITRTKQRHTSFTWKPNAGKTRNGDEHNQPTIWEGRV